MNLTGFRIQMYRSIIDSGWIEVSPLTVMVGKNESGKTTLLKALHKFNPFKPEPYRISQEWPRGHRQERSDSQIVCIARFELTTDELTELSGITDQKITTNIIEVTRDYKGRFEVIFPEGLYPDKLHPNDIDDICASMPEPQEPIRDTFREESKTCREEAVRLAHEGRFADLAALQGSHEERLRAAMTPGNPQPNHQNENNYIATYSSKLREISSKLTSTPSIQKKAHEYIIEHLPTFIYMDEYRAFAGTALLDQIKQRQDQNRLSEEDKTFLMILELSGLNLEDECKKAVQSDQDVREQRQYDLDDAAKTLTREVSDRWRQRKYDIEFRADGNHFYTMVQNDPNVGLIKLEERSKGFQWFFSFDLMLMYESKGRFENCVILLDEPGLHLHPDAQKDLLKRLEAYAEGNTLIYTTHMPFMIDLRKPDRIRVISETETGTKVTDDLMQSQAEAKFTLQAALGMSGSSSYLMSQRNLVVEGVDDYWVISELSNLLIRSGNDGLPEDIFVTAAGGASEAAYIATLMIGQKLEVVVLLDSDNAGEEARDSLIKKWLVRYHSTKAQVLSLGTAVGFPNQEFSIEDMFTEDFYLDKVKHVYKKELTAAGIKEIALKGKDQICKRVERFFDEYGIKFNKGSVAKEMRSALSKMKGIEELPPETAEKAAKLIETVINAFPREN